MRLASRATGPAFWPLGWMVMMNDEQRVDDTLAESPAGADAGESPAAVPADGKTAGPGTPGGDQDEEDAEEAEPRSRWSFMTEMVVLCVVALTIALLIKTFVVQPFWIPSASMEDTLLIGDKVLVNKLVYHLRPIERGDIVVFNGSGSWNPPTAQAAPSHNPAVRLYDDTLGPLFRSFRGLFGADPGQTDYIKRVIGLPGDHVACCDAQGDITVNGVALHEKSYLFPGNQPSQGRFSIVVPPGRLWVMGDHRIDSSDSRLHDCAYTFETPTCEPYDRNGTIPEDKVIGRAFLIVWPPSRFRILPIPTTFSQQGLNKSGSAAAPAAAVPARALGALNAGIPVRASGSYLPLAAGFAFAVPLTVAERRLRLRRRRRRAGIRRPAGRRDGRRAAMRRRG